jgi:nucleoside-diphosphate-sugar epimerase
MNALVTGAGGFLGGAIARMLVARGDTVRSISRSAYPELDALGVAHIQADLSDADAVARAAEGCDTVFHVAAKAGVWGAYAAYHQANVVGTENVIAACRQHEVGRLVYTSTPSVTFDGHGEEGVDESRPYAPRPLCHYATTKIEAEKKVLAANEGTLASVSLRPHLIWGPNDTNLTPRVIDRGRKGKLALLGDGSPLVDTVYIDNAAEAHLLAADALGEKSACAGKAYYISNDEPVPMETILNGILTAAELPPIAKRIPTGVAFLVGAILEGVYTVLRREDEPMMTRFVARQLSTPHWFDISAAKADFGYAPRVSIEEGLARLKEHLAAH